MTSSTNFRCWTRFVGKPLGCEFQLVVDAPELPYHTNVRSYPPVTILRRVYVSYRVVNAVRPKSHEYCSTRKDSIIPLSEPVWGLDGTKLKEIPVPRGTQIIIGVLGANARKELWGEDSLEWRPERWISPLPRRVTEAGIPGVYSNLCVEFVVRAPSRPDKLA